MFRRSQGVCTYIHTSNARCGCHNIELLWNPLSRLQLVSQACYWVLCGEMQMARSFGLCTVYTVHPRSEWHIILCYRVNLLLLRLLFLINDGTRVGSGGGKAGTTFVTTINFWLVPIQLYPQVSIYMLSKSCDREYTSARTTTRMWIWFIVANRIWWV